MTKFIRKLFIKNYTEIENPKVREAHGVMASIFGIITNLLLFCFKITVGLLTFSMSIIADAINNLTDFFSCGVNLIGFKVASKPADKDHPYGHERIEYLAGLIISFIIVVVAVLLFNSSITELINPEKTLVASIWPFIIMPVAIIVKIVLGLFYRSIGKTINSLSLKAAMQDSINDAIVTGVVLVAQIIQYYVPEAWYIDSSVSLVLSLFVLYSGIKMIKETMSPLIGKAPELKNVEEIKENVKKISGVIGVHDMIFHSYGPTKNYLTLHIEVDGKLNLFDAHTIADEVENFINKTYFIETTVHIDPVDIESEDFNILKNKINEIIKNVDSSLSFHDLRKIGVANNPRIIFDLEINENCKEKPSDVILTIANEIKKEYPKYKIEIKPDNNYIG